MILHIHYLHSKHNNIQFTRIVLQSMVYSNKKQSPYHHHQGRKQSNMRCGGQISNRPLICLESGEQVNDPSLGKHFSLPFLPATFLSPSLILEWLFELTLRPSRALDSPRALLSELQRSKDTIRSGALGAEVPGHRQQQLTQP